MWAAAGQWVQSPLRPAPHTDGQEAKAAPELQMPRPLVFISTAEVLGKGEELTHLGSQALQL